MQRPARMIAIATLTLAALATLTPPVAAAPGDLDPSFSGDGQAFVDVAPGHDRGMAVALQPNGRILVAGVSGPGGHGNFGVIRLKPNGQLDPTFGGDGRVTTDFGGDEWAFAMSLQPNGRIVVAGSRGTAPARMAVARYLPDGSLDHSFSGDGKRVVSVGSSLGATTVAVGPSGAITLAGDAPGKMSVVRLLPRGSLDAGFGQGGIRTIARLGSTVGSAYGVTIDGAGRTVVVGSVGEACATDLVAVRLTAGGAFDPTFSGDGRFTLDLGKVDAGLALVRDGQGRIVVGGYTGSCPHADGERMLLMRLTAHGASDQSFSGDGRVLTNFGPAGDEIGDVALDGSGRIVAVGLTGLSSSGGGDVRIAVVRYKPGGALDGSFGGGDGKVELDPAGDFTPGRGVAAQTDGALLVVGEASDPAEFYAARLVG